MLDVIRDARGRVVCKGDPMQGIVETRYCKFAVRTALGKGESIAIERDGLITTIIRTTDNRFVVHHLS